MAKKTLNDEETSPTAHSTGKVPPGISLQGEKGIKQSHTG